jgi:hypothetical protein
MRFLKRGSYKKNYAEIPVHIEIEVEIPDDPKFEAKGKIKLSEKKFGEIIINEIVGDLNEK